MQAKPSQLETPAATHYCAVCGGIMSKPDGAHASCMRKGERIRAVPKISAAGRTVKIDGETFLVFPDSERDRSTKENRADHFKGETSHTNILHFVKQ